MEIKQRQDRALWGIILMLIAYLLFSFIDTSAKWLSALGLPAMQLAFMRYFGHLVISTGLISNGVLRSQPFVTEHVLLVMLRGGLLVISTILNFWALRYLPLTLTATILFSSPLFICLLSWKLLGERVGIYRWAAIIVGFVGVTIAIRPFDESFHWAMLLSIAAAFCFALYAILTRKLSGLVSVDVMQFYSGALGAVILLPFALYVWQMPETLFQWTVLVGLGIFGWAGHELLTRAHHFATASTLTPFGYSFILYLTVWSYIIFDYLPDRWTIIGGTLITCAGIFIWLRETRRKV